MKTSRLTALIIACGAPFTLLAQQQHAPVTSTRSTVESLMQARTPSLQFDPEFTPTQMKQWQDKMSKSMTELMRHPDAPAAPCEFIKEEKRDGYTIQRWLSHPLPGSSVAFYVLIPDGVSASSPAPAALCIPGFGQTKELLAGELDGDFSLTKGGNSERKAAEMARILASHGMVAVAVDNPSCGELSDNGVFDYLESSRFLLELGWSYLGLASWQDKVVLDWMKTNPAINPNRIIISGFSLGTEPMMVLGLIDPSIHAFVYNDFLCRTRERALVMNAPDNKGRRTFPNSIEHLIPEFLTRFDFPDIVAALAPRPVICTEGGLDRDFGIIAQAYATAGAPEAFEWHHYRKFENPSDRVPVDTLPNGIDRATFFRMVNVDPPNHYFKAEHILPWLQRLGLTSR